MREKKQDPTERETKTPKCHPKMITGKQTKAEKNSSRGYAGQNRVVKCETEARYVRVMQP
jgi:hypothetical protein